MQLVLVKSEINILIKLLLQIFKVISKKGGWRKLRNENFVHCQPYSPSHRAEVAQAVRLLEQSLENRGIVVRLPAQARELVFFQTSRSILGNIQPSFQLVQSALPLQLKNPWYESELSPPTSDELNNACS